jgi:hypothetical protein
MPLIRKEKEKRKKMSTIKLLNKRFDLSTGLDIKDLAELISNQVDMVIVLSIFPGLEGNSDAFIHSYVSTDDIIKIYKEMLAGDTRFNIEVEFRGYRCHVSFSEETSELNVTYDIYNFNQDKLIKFFESNGSSIYIE